MAAYQYIYVMKGLSKTYPGGRQVLKDIWLSFLPGAKIGVLGMNGAGKSTLLRVMAGEDHEFVGEAWAAEGIKIGFLKQEPALDTNRSIVDNVMDGVRETKAVLDRFNEVSAMFAEEMSDDAMNALIAEQARAAGKDRRRQCLGARAHGRDRDGRAALPAGRCRHQDAVRRRKAPRGAVPAAVVEAGYPPARRADQPP